MRHARLGRGFTLIETLVALSLLGLIATMLVSATRLGLDLSQRGNSKADRIRTERMEFEFLRGQLQAALPFHYWTEEAGRRQEHVAFDASEKRIRFVSRNGITDGTGNLPRWVELREEQAGSQSRLVLEERRILPPLNQPSDSSSARAEFVGCADIHLEFLRLTQDGPQWNGAWDPSLSLPLPAAVRLVCRAKKPSVMFLISLDYAEAARQGLKFQ
jgi:prepilin-type N-terminal cleavage/methylation domain-containing protein